MPAPPRFSPAARKVIASPDEILRSYLVPNEAVIMRDAPALSAFIVDQLIPLLLVGFGAIALLWMATEGTRYELIGIGFVVLGIALGIVLVKRATQYWTIYVLTSFRVMRIKGVLKRENAWIPWAKVTDVRFESTIMGRVLGYATVYIDSANEESQLKRMSNLRHPHAFFEILSRMVQSRWTDLKAPEGIEDFVPVRLRSLGPEAPAPAPVAPSADLSDEASD
jgi:hypothetical protein